MGLTSNQVKDGLRRSRLAGHQIQPAQFKWYNIIQEIKKALPFWEGRRKPTLRTIHYNLETIAKETGKIEYKRDYIHYRTLSRISSIARKQPIDPDYQNPHMPNTKLPTLPIDCFVDEGRLADGQTDIIEPREPEPPQNPDDYIIEQ